MPLYPNPAGGSMTAANDADAKSKGWSSSMGTFGVQTYPSGGGGGGGAAPAAAGNPDLAGYVAAMQASSGLSIKQLEEQKRQFDATLQQQKDMWALQGLPQLAIQQRAQDLEDKKFAELQSQAVFSQNLQTAQQALQEKVQLGQLSVQQAQQALAEKIQTGQLAVSQGQLGLDTLKTAASLSGPENFIQAANFNRGVAANSLLPGFVSNLLSGQSTATLGGVAPGAQMSAPLSLGGIAAQQGVVPQYVQAAPVVQAAPAAAGAAPDAAHMAQFYAQAVNAANTGGSTGAAVAAPVAADGAPAAAAIPQYATQADVGAAFGRPTAQQTQTDAAAAGLRKVYAAGGQALAPQQLEGLTPTEMSMFTGGGAAVGADVPGYVDAYKRSRIGQSAAKPAFATS